LKKMLIIRLHDEFTSEAFYQIHARITTD